MRSFSSRLPARFPALLAGAVLFSACGGGATPGATRPAALDDAAWRALATPRPEPLSGAARVSVGEMQLLAQGSVAVDGGVDPALGLRELVSLGLLRRRDVHFVERRRFAEAAERERRGHPRPAGAPPAGVSPGAEFVVTATWASVGLDSAFVDLRLTEASTGRVVTTWRGATAPDADLASVARRVVSGVLQTLEARGRRPAWTDPEPLAAPDAYRPSGVPPGALAAFLQGLAAEEQWNWEAARVGYQTAADAAAFVEARAALARAARLRTGGTLAGS